MVEYSIIRSADGPSFYVDMGPFFASRAVQKELGWPFYDDARFAWVIAKEHGVVVGWAALVREPRGVSLEWAYVVPACRRRGIYRELFRRRLEQAGSAVPIRGMTANPFAQRVYEQAGFALAGSRGAWKKYARGATVAA